MELITNNPYRQLGLLVGATAKQESNHKTKINQYLDADHEIPSQYIEYGFKCFGEIQRTTQHISTAEAKLTLGEDRVSCALFWFWNGNPITDEPAFDALKEGDIDTALQIWENLITSTKEDGKKLWKQVTENNFSAFHNFFVISMISKTGNINNGIVSNLKFIESDFITKFSQIVSGVNYKSSKKELQLLFLNQLLQKQEIKLNKLTRIFNNNTFSGKAEFYKIIIHKLTEPIEQKIEIAKSKRKYNKENANVVGKELYDTTISDINTLKSCLKLDNITYSTLADKLANEILQCSIEYFNAHNEDRSNCFETTLILAKLAEELAVGKIVKNRIRENIESLETMRYREINDAIKALKTIKDAYIKILFSYENTGNHYNIDENKVNEMFKEVFTTKVVNKIITCENINLLETFITLLDNVIKESFEYEWLRSKCQYFKIVESLPFNSTVRIKIETELKNKENVRIELQKQKIERNKIIRKNISIELSIITFTSLLGLIIGIIADNQIYYTDIEYWIGLGVTGFGLGILILSIIEWKRNVWNFSLLLFITILSVLLTIVGLIYSIWGFETIVEIGTIIGGLIAFIVMMSVLDWMRRN